MQFEQALGLNDTLMPCGLVRQNEHDNLWTLTYLNRVSLIQYTLISTNIFSNNISLNSDNLDITYIYITNIYVWTTYIYMFWFGFLEMSKSLPTGNRIMYCIFQRLFICETLMKKLFVIQQYLSLRIIYHVTATSKTKTLLVIYYNIIFVYKLRNTII